MQLSGGRYLVLGLGVSGFSAAETLLDATDAGADITVTVVDTADSDVLRERAGQLASRGAQVMLGMHRVSDSFDTVVVSPGIPPSAELMVSACAATMECISEIELAFRLSASPWIAVTGTNGKTTVTSLIAHLLRSSMMPAEVLGNIGPAATRVAMSTGAGTTLVAEVSSFQLANSVSFHPRVAVLLNITPDHLDWHGGMEAYVRDKARVFEHMTSDDTAVIDIDDAGSAPFAEILTERGVRVIRVSTERATDGGAWMEDGRLFVDLGGVHELCAVSDLRIQGVHNVSNALAGAAAALACGAEPHAVAEGLVGFEPIEHRLEPVEEIDGVEYFNDSKATNPDAVIKALSAFVERPVVLLLGGRNKENRFDTVAAAARGRCRSVIAFGEAGVEVVRDLVGLDCDVYQEPDLAAAVVRASAVAHGGDVVLLSPACASFDEFQSYAHRGRVFKQLVRGISDQAISKGDGS